MVEYALGNVSGAALFADGYDGTAIAVVDTEREVLLGVTFVGPGVAEMLQAATIAVVGEVPIGRLWHAVPAYPDDERDLAAPARDLPRLTHGSGNGASSGAGRSPAVVAVTSIGPELRDPAEQREERGVGGVAAGADAHQRAGRGQPGGVDDAPRAVDVGLDHGVEVHRGQARRVDGDQPGRDLQRPQQGDGQVRVVAADALAGEQRVDGGVDRPARPGGVDQPPVHPVGDRRDQLGARQRAVELGGGEPLELVRRAVAAGAERRPPTPRGSPSAAAPPACDRGGVGDGGVAGVQLKPVHAGAVDRELLDSTGRPPESTVSCSVAGSADGDLQQRGRRLGGGQIVSVAATSMRIRTSCAHLRPRLAASVAPGGPLA